MQVLMSFAPKKFMPWTKLDEKSPEEFNARLKAFRRALFGCALSLCLVITSCVIIASQSNLSWADVRRGDVIAGSTVEQRGISSSLCPSIDAAYAIVVDENGKVYFERDALSPTQIASITKIMTATVALDIADTYNLLNEEITVSARAASIGESSAELLEGDMLSVEEALEALMIPSGNDAAMALAENLGRYIVADNASQTTGDWNNLTDTESNNDPITNGEDNTLAEGQISDDESLAAFVSAMNDKAAEIGCTDTYFDNPHGLDGDNYGSELHSTASDVAKISFCAMQNEVFRNIVSTDRIDITVLRENQEVVINLETTDLLLGVYEGACGIKTGYTSLAGSCFAGASHRDDSYLYAIVLNSTSDDQRFVDVQALFDWVYSNSIDYPLANSSQTVSMVVNGQRRVVPVVAEVSHTDWIDKTVKGTFADPDASVEVFSLDGNVSQSFEFYELSGNVKEGDVIGCATFYQHNDVIATQDIVAAEDVDAPGFFDSFGIWWNRLIRSIFGGDRQADSVVLNDTPLIYDKQST